MGKYSKILECYSAILTLQEKQLELEIIAEQDEGLNQFASLEQDIYVLIESIKRIEEQESLEYSAEEEQTLSALILKMMDNNQHLITKLDSIYKDASHVMKQVSRHKKTLATYGGVDQYDEIAYYFDEKR